MAGDWDDPPPIKTWEVVVVLILVLVIAAWAAF